MRGRLLVCLLLLLAVSGCVEVFDGGAEPEPTATPSPAEWDGHPENHWRSDELTVAYEALPGDDRDYEPLVREALSFWDDRDERYLGFPLSLRLAEAGEEPDVRVRFVDGIEYCGEEADEYSAGCAPLYTDHRQVDRPTTIRVATGYSDESTRLILKHELGHVLGLTHDDEPAAVMDATTELRTLPKPNATDRALPWRRANLTVHVDYDGASDRDAAEGQIAAALEYFEAGADGTVPDNVTFERTDDRDAADVAIDFATSDPCRSGSGSCGRVRGVDLDGDGAFEYHTRAEITLVDLDSDAVAWHAGRWLARSFGAVAESDYPEPLRSEASYEERRGEWWR